eukprot:1126243-Pyramimonas_sp.AAC.1
MEDRFIEKNSRGEVNISCYDHVFGAAHPLIGQSRKSKRVSYSTSHAETVSAVGGSQMAQFTALRFTEILIRPQLDRGPEGALKMLM